MKNFLNWLDEPLQPNGIKVYVDGWDPPEKYYPPIDHPQQCEDYITNDCDNCNALWDV